MFRQAVLLVAGIVIGLASPASAQEIKPRQGPMPRLAAPAKIVASQERPQNFIRVVWSSVPGAASYQLIRSAPPDRPEELELPNPSDTEYVDSNVKPGSTYYYQVAAINEDGLLGLKRGAAPVEFREFRALDTPTGVRAVLDSQVAAVRVYWNAVQGGGYYYRIEPVVNGVADDGVTANRSPYLYSNPERYPSGTRLSFRVTAWDIYGNHSEPAISNEVTTVGRTTTDTTPADTTVGKEPSTDTTSTQTTVRPTVVGPNIRVKVGGSLGLAKGSTFINLHLRQPRWVSLDPSKAKVNARGQVLGQSPGFTYVMAIGTTADGSIASLIQRVDVTRH